MAIKKVLAANIVGHWDFRKGNALDQSQNSNNGTINGTPYWINTEYGKALHFIGTSAAYVNIGDVSAVKQTGDFSMGGAFLWDGDTTSNLVPFGKGVTTSFTPYYWVMNSIAGNIGVSMANSAGDAFLVAVGDCDFAMVHGLNYVMFTKNGTDFTTFLNGTPQASKTLSSATNEDDTSAFRIGAASTGFNVCKHPILETIIFDTALTDLQVSQLYEEFLQEAHIEDLPKRNFQLPELAAYNNFERDSVWTKGTGWTIATGKASSDGTQTADSDLTQNIGTIGRVYTIQYEISGYSAGNLTGLAGTAEGTDRSANGVYTDVITCAGSGLLGLRADLDFVGNIEWVKIGQGYKTVYRNTFEDAPVTITALGSGDIGGFHINSGTWKASNDGTDTWLECITAGQAYTKSQLAYGTWQWDIYKGSESTQPVVLFMADTIGSPSATGQDGYFIGVSNTELIQLGESTNGSQAALSQTAASYVAAQTKYSIRITRNYAGSFTLYIKGGVYSSWTDVDVTGGSGTNPVTDTTTTASKYTVLDFGIGDKITNIKFWEGVVTPSDLA